MLSAPPGSDKNLWLCLQGRKKDVKDMLLAIDVGNTNIEFGVLKEGSLLASFRLGTNREITSDEVGLHLLAFFQIHHIKVGEIAEVLITSVVPQINYSMTNAVRKYIGKEALVVGENISIQIENLYDKPEEVGADRLVDALAGYRKYGGPLIVVDFGTATTFDAINAQGAYLGGGIYPGIRISMDALFQKTAKLPRVELVKPDSVIGKNTIHSLQSGAIYGYVGATENIIHELKKVLGEDAKVVATGGFSRLIGQYTKAFQTVDRHLTLDGLWMIYQDYLATKG